MSRLKLIVMIAAGVLGSVQRCVPAAPPPPVEGPLTPGHIVVTPGERGAAISPYLFGAAIEWTDHGNFFADPATGRVRDDVVAAFKPLHLPVIRFPGGILADYYHWKDGIGPVAQRPVRKNPMDNTDHANTFGTDEFIAVCKALGADPLVTANFGTGTLDEALAWQAYFASKDLPVRAWEIGNEVYLAEPKAKASIPGNDERIYHTPAQYADAFKTWSAALHKAQPDAEVGAIAGTYNTSQQNRGWLDVLDAKAANDLDFVALHNAFAPLIFGAYDYKSATNRRDAYRAMYAQALASAEDSRSVTQKLAQARGGKAAKIAITEHFPLFGGGGGQEQLFAVLDQSKTLGAALYSASLFHGFMREGLWMANYNLTLGKWFGALITDTDKGLVRTPTYHVFDLYRNHFGNRLIGAHVESPSYSSKAVGTVAARQGVPYLDAVASRDDRGNVYLAVINRHFDSAIPATLEVIGLTSGTASVLTLTGPAANAINGPSLGASVTPGAVDAIHPVSSTWEYARGQSYPFPPRSVTVFQWKTSRG